MPARVADASVIAALAFEEPRSEEALSLVRGIDLYEPTLLAYELASIARKKALLYPDRADAIIRALELAQALEARWVEVDQVAVLRLALDTGLTTYDASYLYVARILGASLATFDEQLDQASRR